MAHAKVSVSDVKDLFDTVLTDDQLQAFVDVAHRRVDGALSGESLLDDADLQDIEKFYAAGLAELRDPRASSERAAGTRVDYEQGSYLETAFSLDPTGKLQDAHESTGAMAWQVGGFDID